MKKYIKIVVLAVALFFTFTMPCFAKTMTLSELENEIQKVEPYAGYAYIIGQYVFTSEYPMQLSDIVLASTSINSQGNKTDPSKINIYQLLREYDDDYNPSGWKKAANALGTGALSGSIDIRYIDYEHIGDASSASINFDIEKDSYSTYKNVLQTALGFSKDKFYGDKLSFDGGKVKGLLLKKSVDDITYNDEDKERFAGAKYFFAYVLEVPNATTKTTVKASGIDGKLEAVDIKDFDIKVDAKDQTPGIVTLVAIDPTKWDDSDKKINVVVDLDGDDDYYNPIEQVIDISELTFQSDSSEKSSLGESQATQKDKEKLKDYGYDSSLNDNIKFTSDEKDPLTIKLEGKLVEQTINKGVFGEDKEAGYFFDFTFALTGNENKIATIQLLKDKDNDGNNVSKTYVTDEYDEKGNLTILFRIDPKVSCSAEANNCKAYFKVDLDGDGKEYLPVIYTIDYSGVTLEKSSIFTVASIDSSKKDEFGDDAWYDTNNGYSVDVQQDESTTNLYHVSGVLPIIEDSDWEGNEPSDFKDKGIYYYLGLKLTLLNGTEGFDSQSSTIDIKFDHEQNQPSLLGTTDFAKSNVLYLLKALKASSEDGDALKNDEKWFTITVDLDGNGAEYEAYTVTIDYAGLEFQDVSKGAGDFDVIDVSSLEVDSPVKKELDDYEFKNVGSKDVSVEIETVGDEGNEPSKTGLTGTVREQKLSDKAGFSDNNGYFVPVKISLPTDEEWYQRHKNDWTITLYDENGSKQSAYNPKEYERNQGWLLVLFKLDRKDKENDKLKFTIDFDGDGKAFLPYDYEISYKDLTFHSENQIKFEYFDETSGKIIDEPVIIYENETISNELIPTFNDKNYTYHTFDYWYDSEKDTSEHIDFGSKITGENEDITVKAHWTIDSDKFFEDVVTDLANPNSKVSKDFSDIFEVTKEGNIITFNVINSTTKLSELNNTSIPGAIAYILQRGEVKDITLSAGEKKVIFTKEGANNQVIQKTALDDEGNALKETIQKGAQALFVDILGSSENEQKMTLNNMALAETNNNFTITIGKLDDTVALASDSPTEYTFNFTTDVAAVTSKETLEQALQKEMIKHIDITEDFSVENPISVQKKVTINGGPDGTKHTLTATNGGESIFKISNENVTIDNIKLKGVTSTKNLITVESGSLTSKGLEVEVAEDSLPESFEAAIEVKNGATVTISEMKFEKEHYTKPAIKAEKGSAVVNLIDSEGKKALNVEKYNVSNTNTSDSKTLDSSYSYYNYYNEAKNSVIYETKIYNFLAGYRLVYVKYNYYGENLTAPTGGGFGSFESDGEKYELIGFAQSSSNVLSSDGNLPQGATDKDKLSITKDGGHYWGVYKVSLVEGIKKVSSEQDFKDAISKLEQESIKAIYVSQSMTIDYTKDGDGTFKIPKDVSIIGLPKSTGTVTIKAKKVEIGDQTNSVTVNRINFQIDAQENQDSLIEVKGKKLTLWQSGLENISETNKVDYAIKYSNDTSSVVDVRYMGIDSNGFKPKNINKAYIYVSGKLGAGSDLYQNSFKVEGGEAPKSAILINGFASQAKALEVESGEPNIRFESNTFNTSYAVTLQKNVSGQNADIKFDKGTLAVEWDESYKNFQGIGLYSNPSNVKVKYINVNTQDISESIPEGVSGVVFKAQVVMSDSGDYEETRINGLNKNEDGNYSGTIIQNTDGNFYLPVVLTSENFDDRVSKVKITDPNNESQEYIYSKYTEDGIAPIISWFKISALGFEEDDSNNIGIMKLNLEAIKTSKIKGENGKQYTIEFDYNGDGEYESSSILNYSEVKTEEEIILEAAENTQKATSLTVTKSNRINGLDEKFSYKYDTDKEVTIYSEDGQDKEYTFKYKKVDDTHKGEIIIAVRKAAEGDANICEKGVCIPTINDWTFANFFTKVSRGYHELSLLQDLIKDKEVVLDAISKVSKVQDHKYQVTLNQKRLNDWLNNAYLSSEYFDPNQKDTSASPDEGTANGNDVILEVELDSNNQYIVSIKTKEKFSVTSNEGKEHDDNQIDVKFENPNSTSVEDALEFLGKNEQKATLEEIKKFYEDCKKWHTVHTGATIFEE